MKPEIQIVHRAIPRQITSGKGLPCVLNIDGEEFTSEFPRGEAHAAAINAAAERLVEEMRKAP